MEVCKRTRASFAMCRRQDDGEFRCDIATTCQVEMDKEVPAAEADEMADQIARLLEVDDLQARFRLGMRLMLRMRDTSMGMR